MAAAQRWFGRAPSGLAQKPAGQAEQQRQSCVRAGHARDWAPCVAGAARGFFHRPSRAWPARTQTSGRGKGKTGSSRILHLEKPVCDGAKAEKPPWCTLLPSSFPDKRTAFMRLPCSIVSVSSGSVQPNCHGAYRRTPNDEKSAGFRRGRFQTCPGRFRDAAGAFPPQGRFETCPKRASSLRQRGF